MHPVFEFVYEQHVVLLQRWKHGVRRNVKRPYHERNQKERGQTGDDEGVEIFANGDFRAVGFETQRDPSDGKNADQPQQLQRRKR
jgi:hypothetical protein